MAVIPTLVREECHSRLLLRVVGRGGEDKMNIFRNEDFAEPIWMPLLNPGSPVTGDLAPVFRPKPESPAPHLWTKLQQR